MITEPARRIPLVDEADVLILGGGTTGVCAAVRSARRGLRTVLVERHNMLGGTATTALVTHWPSGRDARYEERIIGGLSLELINRLEKRGQAVQEKHATRAYSFVQSEMVGELEKLALEAGVVIHLHTWFAAPWCENDRLCGVFVENKDGRGAIAARVVIDCTGDGDLLYRLGVPAYEPAVPQPPTGCFLLHGMNDIEAHLDWIELVRTDGARYGITPDCGWNYRVPGRFDVRVVAELHTFGGNLCHAADLTAAELASRSKARAFIDLIRDHMPKDKLPLLSVFAGMIGIRQTRQFKSLRAARGDDLLAGVIPGDCIGLSSNRIDIHGQDGSFTFRYLNGEEMFIRNRQTKPVMRRWRPDDGRDVRYYGLPFSCTVPDSACPNLLMAGRMLDADSAAFGALRLQMYLNEFAEAAGEAAVLMIERHIAARDVNPAELRERLIDGGTILKNK